MKKLLILLIIITIFVTGCGEQYIGKQIVDGKIVYTANVAGKGVTSYTREQLEEIKCFEVISKSQLENGVSGYFLHLRNKNQKIVLRTNNAVYTLYDMGSKLDALYDVRAGYLVYATLSEETEL